MNLCFNLSTIQQRLHTVIHVKYQWCKGGSNCICSHALYISNNFLLPACYKLAKNKKQKSVHKIDDIVTFDKIPASSGQIYVQCMESLVWLNLTSIASSQQKSGEATIFRWYFPSDHFIWSKPFHSSGLKTRERNKDSVQCIMNLFEDTYNLIHGDCWRWLQTQHNCFWWTKR